MRELWRSSIAKLVAVVVVLALLVWAIVGLRGVVTPFAVAFALAYFLNPPVNILERGLLRVLPARVTAAVPPRTLAVGILCVLVVALFVLVLLIVVPTAFNQVEETAHKAPGWVANVRAKLEPVIQKASERYPKQAAAVRLGIEKAMNEHLFAIVKRVTKFAQTAIGNVLSVAIGIFNLVIVPIFAVYLLYDMNHIKQGTADLVPERYRPYVYSRLREVDRLLSAFARGQLTVCLILGTFYAIALTLCGVPLGLLVGMVIGFFNMIPFMSTVLGLPLAVTLSLIDDQSLRAALAVTAVFFFGQFVEGNFITPRIVGRGLGLHAVVIMLAVLVGGAVFGFIGMLVAVPVTAALSVFWSDLRDLYLRSDFYRGSPTPPSAA